MKCVQILFCMFCALAHVPAFSSADWPNEPAGATNVLDCPFSGQLCQGMFNVYKNQPFANDPAAPLSPSGVLDYFLPAGATSGGGQFGYDFQTQLGHKVHEVYVGTWWKTNPEFDGNINGFNKMIFVQGFEAGGGGNIIVWAGPVEGPKEIMFVTQHDTQFGAGNCHIPNWQNYGLCQSTTTFPNGTHGYFSSNVGSGSVGPGTGWHRIETYQKSSTTYTSRDGIIRMWLDNRLILDVRNANLLPNGFTDIQYNSTWDGSSNMQCNVRDCSRERHHYYDHLRISIPNCGSGGCPAPAYLLINSSLPAARTGTPFTATLSADGGTKPYTWFRESGALPNGLTLNQSTGVISGTPTCVGRSDFTIRVTDASSPALSATKSYTIITSGTGTCASGMEEMKELTVNGLQLTAEPRTESVRFHLPQPGAYSLSVYDLTGREVWRNYSNAEAVWNHGGKLKKGVYLVRAEQGGNTMSTTYCHMW